MRSINKYLIEALISRNTEIQTYHFHPKSFSRLRKLLKQLLEERGPDADLNDIDVSKVTEFYNVYNKLGLFEDLDPHNIKIDKWNVSNVRHMYSTFYKCQNLNCNLSKWDVRNVEDMSFMFWLCKNFDCNLSKWNVSRVETMDHMFYGCTKFTGQGLENWKPIKVYTISNMFYGCTNLDCNLEKWPLNKLKYSEYAFNGCKNKPSWYTE